jgi:glycosyltransferase involved in cell wall biosynthesis
MLTIQIIIKNHKEVIKQTLESVKGFSVIILDIGSTDGTTRICEEYGYRPVKVSGDRSKIRNEVARDWNMYLEPGEVIVSGREYIKEGLEGAYRFEVIQGDIITKPIRMWQKSLKFVNPVFEKIIDDKSGYLPVVIWKDDFSEDVDLEGWKKADPLAVEPYYYQAFSYLRQKKYKEFISSANYYIFNQMASSIEGVMMRYYLSIVNCLIINNLEGAIRDVLICLGENILMAEFWCLLGDIYCKIREFPKAMHFYENAIILGNRRLRDDKWPMQISKYEEYPNNMIKICKDYMVEKVKYYSNT